jgi:hypothetical protein
MGGPGAAMGAPGMTGPGTVPGMAAPGGGPRPWPQNPHDATSTLPSGMPYLGPGGQQWGPGGWDQNGPSDPDRSRLGGLRMKRPRGPLIPAIATAAVIVIVAVIIVATRGGGGTTGNNTAAAGTTPTTNASAQSHAAAPNGTTQQQAASHLAAFLTQSGSDRGDVDDAVVNTQDCKVLTADQQVFSRAAANRQNLLAKLGALQGRSTLNQTMIADLTGAWQASAQADSDLAKWAADEGGHCSRGKTGNDPNLKASYGPDGQATTDKQAFTKIWNPLALKYGLRTFQWAQI